MGLNINRRDLLKLLALSPLLRLRVDRFDRGRLRNRWAGSNGPNILMVVSDALSAKHMSLYGYPRNTTPNIERFAKRATVFNRHYAGGNFTTPGTASLLTGVYPWSHRAFHFFGKVRKWYEQHNLFSEMPPSVYRRLAYTHNDNAAMLLYQFRDSIELLERIRDLTLFYEWPLSEGLFINDHNAAFIGEREVVHGHSGENPSGLFLSFLDWIWRTRSKNEITADYHKLFPRGLPSGNAKPILFLLEEAIDWLQSQLLKGPSPTLGYFHFLPPHAPYTTRREFMGIFKDGWAPVEKRAHFFSEGHSQKEMNRQRRLYDEYIAYADSEFGRLYDFLEEEGFLENSYLILTSDHGEMFERGIIAHNTATLYEPIIRVPLVISRPGQKDRIDVDSPTSCIDLLPTLLSVLGRAVPSWCEGQALPTFAGAGSNSERSIFSVEAKRNYKMAPITRATIAMVQGRHKLVHYRGYTDFDEVYELYDVENDPEELHDLFPEGGTLAQSLKQKLIAKLDQVNREASSWSS